jgi:hypothetical protein
LWRHGDRAPNLAWPTDPNQEDSWPQGWGSLSLLGMHQHMQLGRRLRIHLGNFVSRHFVSKEVSNLNLQVKNVKSMYFNFKKYAFLKVDI